jgi:hypothetical protein
MIELKKDGYQPAGGKKSEIIVITKVNMLRKRK